MKRTDEMNTFYEELGHRIEELRESRGWSRETLGEKSQLNRVTIYNIECNHSGATVYSFAQLVRALDASPSYLLFGKLENSKQRLEECMEKAMLVLSDEEIAFLCAVMDSTLEQIKKERK